MGWQRIQGHEAIIQGFRRVYQRKRLAHAYLFLGPAGVGKRLFAEELGKALLCEHAPQPLTACDQCAACVQVDVGTHPDYSILAKPKDRLEFPVDLMREMLGRFALKSARGRGRVVIIDGADDFNAESTNCFLKTLEEPPPGAVIILIGSIAERQYRTIVSRCQLIRFHNLTQEQVREVLKNAQIEEKLLDRVIRLSNGSPGRALSFANATLWEIRNTLLAGLAQRPIEAVELAKAWMEFINPKVEEPAIQRGRASAVVQLLVEYFQDALSVRCGGQPQRSEAKEHRALQELAKRTHEETLLEVIERCLEADMHIDRRVQLVLVIEALLDGLVQKLSV